MADISARYYDPDNLEEKNGVDTIEEFEEVTSELINPQTGMVDLSINASLYSSHNDTNEDIGVKIRTEAAETTENTEPEIVTRDGRTEITVVTYMSSAEYKQYIERVNGAKEHIGLPETAQLSFSLPDMARHVAVYTTVNIAEESLKTYKAFSMLEEATGAALNLSNLSKGFDSAFDIYDAVNVSDNPNISESDKMKYTALKVAKNFNIYLGSELLSKGGQTLGAGILDGPGAILGYVAGHAVSGALDYALDEALSDMEKQMYGDEGADNNSSGTGNGRFGGTRTYNSSGSQCTNAGKTVESYYIPKYQTPEGTKPTVMLSSRMYDGEPFAERYHDEDFGGDKYKHEKAVDYSHYVNGVMAGVSENNGLTKLTSADLSMAADYLKPGEINEIKTVYNTNPGHYRVKTDTQLMLGLPSGTMVGYIDGAEELSSDVRALPDFAVYPESINLWYTPKTGEENTVEITVNNRGSAIGWADITVTDKAGNVLYFADNRFIDANSAADIKFLWTPMHEEDEIRVEVTNAGMDSEERDTKNNTAVLVVDERLMGSALGYGLPEILGISPQLQESGTTVYFTADIENGRYISDIAFKIDGRAYTYKNGSIDVTYTDKIMRAILALPSPGVGLHTVEVRAAVGESVVSKSSEVMITTPQREGVIRFFSEEGNDSFVDARVMHFRNGMYNGVYRYDDTEVSGELKRVTDNLYELSLGDEVDTEALEEYYVLLMQKGVVYYIPLNELDNMMISGDMSLKTNKSYIFEDNGEIIEKVRLYHFGNRDLKPGYGDIELYLGNNRDITFKSTITLAKIHITAFFSVDGIGSSATGINYTLDKSSVDLSVGWKQYSVAVEADRNISVQTFNSAKTQCRIPGFAYDSDKKLLKLLVYGSSHFDGGYVYISCGNALYVTELSKSQTDINLTQMEYGLAEIKLPVGANMIKTVVGIGSEFGAELLGESLKLPLGDHKLSVYYTLNGEQMVYDTQITVTPDEVAVVDLTTEIASVSDIVYETLAFAWDCGFTGAVVSGADVIRAASAENEVQMPMGEYTAKIKLYDDYGTQAELESVLDIDEGENMHRIGKDFSGVAYAPQTLVCGNVALFMTDDLQDEYGNELCQYSSQLNGFDLKGELLLVGEDGSEYTAQISCNNLSKGISVIIPEEMPEGSYSYEIKLCSEGYEYVEGKLYNVNTDNTSPGGIISVGEEQLQNGAVLMAALTCESGYIPVSVAARDRDGTEYPLERIEYGIYKGSMPAADVDICAEFRKISWGETSVNTEHRDGSIRTEAVFKPFDGEEIACRVMLAAYDADGRLQEICGINDVSVQAVTEAEFAADGCDTVKVFVWDNADGIKPLAEKVSVTVE